MAKTFEIEIKQLAGITSYLGGKEFLKSMSYIQKDTQNKGFKLSTPKV